MTESVLFPSSPTFASASSSLINWIKWCFIASLYASRFILGFHITFVKQYNSLISYITFLTKHYLCQLYKYQTQWFSNIINFCYQIFTSADLWSFFLYRLILFTHDGSRLYHPPEISTLFPLLALYHNYYLHIVLFRVAALAYFSKNVPLMNIDP